MLPGIVPNVSTDSVGSDAIITNGRESRNNNYLVDGANNFDDVNGGRSGTQARTALESIQEFQVVTNQFDAEYGRTSGAVVNAVTKQGTNQWRGSAFIFGQDASLTEQEYFAKKNDSPKPETKRQEFGGTFGGPIVRDKAHFFGSVERVLMDEGITINIPSRPEFNTTGIEQTRIWNTVARFDQQVNASNTWGVRWLREYSPQFNQIIDNRTLSAAEEEDDLDQTVVATLNSVFGNRHVNTPAIQLDAGRRRVRQPLLQQQRAAAGPVRSDPQPSRTSSISRATARRRASTMRTRSTTPSRGSFPACAATTTSSSAGSTRYSTIQNSNDGNLNGTFAFGTSNGPYDAANPRTYPDRFSVRVGGPQSSYQKVHFMGAFVQDKWKMNSRS